MSRNVQRNYIFKLKVLVLKYRNFGTNLDEIIMATNRRILKHTFSVTVHSTVTGQNTFRSWSLSLGAFRPSAAKLITCKTVTISWQKKEERVHGNRLLWSKLLYTFKGLLCKKIFFIPNSRLLIYLNVPQKIYFKNSERERVIHKKIFKKQKLSQWSANCDKPWIKICLPLSWAVTIFAALISSADSYFTSFVYPLRLAISRAEIFA